MFWLSLVAVVVVRQILTLRVRVAVVLAGCRSMWTNFTRLALMRSRLVLAVALAVVGPGMAETVLARRWVATRMRLGLSAAVEAGAKRQKVPAVALEVAAVLKVPGRLPHLRGKVSQEANQVPLTAVLGAVLEKLAVTQLLLLGGTEKLFLGFLPLFQQLLQWARSSVRTCGLLVEALAEGKFSQGATVVGETQKRGPQRGTQVLLTLVGALAGRTLAGLVRVVRVSRL